MSHHHRHRGNHSLFEPISAHLTHGTTNGDGDRDRDGDEDEDEDGQRIVYSAQLHTFMPVIKLMQTSNDWHTRSSAMLAKQASQKLADNNGASVA